MPVAVIGLVASLGMVGWLWRHPDVFEPAPALAWAYDAQPVGTVLYFGVTMPAATRDGREITVDRFEPQVTANTSAARITFFACTLDAAGGQGPVAAVRDVNVPCTEVRRLDPGATFETGPDQQVVMSVQPTRPGRVELSGVDLRYAEGWQRGSAWFGSRVVIESTRHRR